MPGLHEVGLAFILVLLCAFLSYWEGHKLAKELLVASLRTILQLLLLGYLLTVIFKHSSLALSLGVGAIMTFNAALHTRERVKNKYQKLFLTTLTSTVVSIWPLAYFGSLLFHSTPWWQADSYLPLLGMLLGNTLNGISLGIDQFTHDVKEKKDDVLAWIALGASNKEATLPLFQRSLRVALTPMMNSMLTMGIVSIPGMMTGQLLSGTSPAAAAMTQMVLMLLIAAGVYVGTFLGLTFSRRRLFNSRGQLC